MEHTKNKFSKECVKRIKRKPKILLKKVSGNSHSVL